jgi:hypothetical protein
MKPRIFVSLFCYPLSKEAAASGTSEQRLIALELELGPKAKWPGFRSLYWLRTLGDVILHLDCSTLIAKARSAAAAQFLTTPAECDVWISIDDDTEATARPLALLIAATRLHDLVVVPQLSSDGKSVNVRFDPDPPLVDELALVRATSPPSLQTRLAPIAFGGCSLMGASRRAIEAMREGFPELVCEPNPWEARPILALFLEQVVKRRWIGEDASFFRRARQCGFVPKVAIDCETRHAGMTLPSTWFDDLCKAEPSSKDG